MSEVIVNIINAILTDPSRAFPLIASIIVLAMAVGIAGNIRSEVARICMLVIMGVIAYIGAIGAIDSIEHDYYINLSTELFGAIASIVIFTGVVTSQGWTFPFICTLILATITMFTVQANNFQDGFALNITTEFVGAFVTTIMLQRNWLWSDKKTNVITRSKSVKRKKMQLEGSYCKVKIRAMDDDDMQYKIRQVKNKGLMVIDQSDKREEKNGDVSCILTIALT